MTCPLHEVLQRMLADRSMSGGGVSRVAGADAGLLLATSAMLGGVNPFPAEGEADARVKAMLDIPLETQSEWARERMNTLIAAARTDGAAVEEIAGGYGGVRIEKNGRILYYVPAADASGFVDGFYVDEFTHTVTVQMTERDGTQRLYTYYNVPVEEMMGFVAATALAKTKTPEEYALVSLHLLRELGTDSVTSAVLLKVIQGEIGGKEVETEDGRRVLRPVVGTYFNRVIKRPVFTEIGSTVRCPVEEELEECLKRRRRRLALDYENGAPRIRMSALEEENGTEGRRTAVAEKDMALRELPEEMDEEARRKYEKTMRGTEDENCHVREASIFALFELIAENRLTQKKRDEAVKKIMSRTEDKDRYVRRASISALARLITENRLTQEERDEAVKKIMSGTEDEDMGVRVTSISALSRLIAENRLTQEERDEAVEKIMSGTEDENVFVCASSITALAGLIAENRLTQEEKDKAIEKIMSGTEDGYWIIREASISALSKLITGNKLTQWERDRAVEKIMSRTKDGHWKVRKVSVSALSKFIAGNRLTQEERDEAVEKIMSGTEDEDEKVRAASIFALARLIVENRPTQEERNEAVEKIMSGTEDGHWKVRAASISALAKLTQAGLLHEEEIAKLKQRGLWYQIQRSI